MMTFRPSLGSCGNNNSLAKLDRPEGVEALLGVQRARPGRVRQSPGGASVNISLQPRSTSFSAARSELNRPYNWLKLLLASATELEEALAIFRDDRDRPVACKDDLVVVFSFHASRFVRDPHSATGIRHAGHGPGEKAQCPVPVTI